MFETEAKKYQEEVILKRDYPHSISVDWQRGAEFGYNKGKDEAKELLKRLIDTLEAVDGVQVREMKVVKEVEQFLKE